MLSISDIFGNVSEDVWRLEASIFFSVDNYWLMVRFKIFGMHLLNGLADYKRGVSVVDCGKVSKAVSRDD